MAPIQTDAHRGLFPALMRVLSGGCGAIPPAGRVHRHDIE
jgi:hypothetical protein